MTTKATILNAALGMAVGPATTELPAVANQDMLVKIIVGALGAFLAPIAAKLSAALVKAAFAFAEGLLRGAGRAIRRVGMRVLQYVRGTPSKADDALGEVAVDFLSEAAKATDKAADAFADAQRDKESE